MTNPGGGGDCMTGERWLCFAKEVCSMEKELKVWVWWTTTNYYDRGYVAWIEFCLENCVLARFTFIFFFSTATKKIAHFSQFNQKINEMYESHKNTHSTLLHIFRICRLYIYRYVAEKNYITLVIPPRGIKFFFKRDFLDCRSVWLSV